MYDERTERAIRRNADMETGLYEIKRQKRYGRSRDVIKKDDEGSSHGDRKTSVDTSAVGAEAAAGKILDRMHNDGRETLTKTAG